MKSSLQTTRRITLLGLALAALLSGGTAGAEATPKPDLTATARMELHFQHEDALYAAKSTSGQARSPAESMALHFKHEDMLYRARASASGPAQLAGEGGRRG